MLRIVLTEHDHSVFALLRAVIGSSDTPTITYVSRHPRGFGVSTLRVIV